MRSCARVFVKGCWVKVSVGGCVCLGAGCVVSGGGLPVWLGDAVASGGVSVGFDVVGRVFVLSGAGVLVSVDSASGGAGGSGLVGAAASGSGFASVGSSGVPGSAPVSGLVGSGAGVRVGGSCGSGSGGSVSSSAVAVSGPVGVAGGAAVCVPCARAVFGDGWCGLVLRRWCAAAGVDVAQAGVLLGSAPVSGSSSGRVSSSSVLSPLSGSASVGSPLSVPSSAVANGGGRVGVGFGARVRDWGARVGVGGGVVSGGGVVAGWWAGVVGRVRALASGVSVWGLVLAGLVGVAVLVSVLVLVG